MISESVLYEYIERPTLVTSAQVIGVATELLAARRSVMAGRSPTKLATLSTCWA